MKTMMISRISKISKRAASASGHSDEYHKAAMLNFSEDKNNEHGFIANNDDENDTASESKRRPSGSLLNNFLSTPNLKLANKLATKQALNFK